jgi:hypothetical protein
MATATVKTECSICKEPFFNINNWVQVVVSWCAHLFYYSSWCPPQLLNAMALWISSKRLLSCPYYAIRVRQKETNLSNYSIGCERESPMQWYTQGKEEKLAAYDKKANECIYLNPDRWIRYRVRSEFQWWNHWRVRRSNHNWSSFNYYSSNQYYGTQFYPTIGFYRIWL